MGHFSTIVVLPEKTDISDHDAVMKAITTLVEPYDENMEVAEYPDECWCGRNAEYYEAKRAYTDALSMATYGFSNPETLTDRFNKGGRQEIIDQILGYPDIVRSIRTQIPVESFTAESLNVPYPEKGEDPTLFAWTHHIVDLLWQKYSKQFFTDRDAWDKQFNASWTWKHDPECEDCHGTGTLTSTYNPESKWDWWEIGGRWCHSLVDRECNWTGDWTCDDDSHWKDNVIVANQIVRDWNCFAIVTPTGQWASRGKMGWFVSTDNNEDWDLIRQEILSGFAEHHICIVDMHI